MRGTHSLRNSSALFSPPGLPSTHGSSWPSLHRLGVMKRVVGRRRDRPQVVRQPVERDVVGVAAPLVVDDRVEVDERVVAGGVLVAHARALRGVRLVGSGVAACLGLVGRVPHVLHVAAPGQVLGLQLVGDRLDRGRVDAALPHRLAVGADGPREDVHERRAVGLRHRIRGLAAHQGDVVAEREVRGRVEVGEQLALGGQRVGQVRRRRVVPERFLVVLVLEDDDADVLDRRRGGVRRRRAESARR